MRAAQDLEADLGARVEALFGRCPELYGFLVEERVVEAPAGEGAARELELYIAGIDVFPALGTAQSETLVAQISAALAEPSFTSTTIG